MVLYLIQQGIVDQNLFEGIRDIEKVNKASFRAVVYAPEYVKSENDGYWEYNRALSINEYLVEQRQVVQDIRMQNKLIELQNIIQESPFYDRAIFKASNIVYKGNKVYGDFGGNTIIKFYPGQYSEFVVTYNIVTKF